MSRAELDAQAPAVKNKNYELTSESLKFLSYVAETRDMYPLTFFVNALDTITKPDDTLRAALFTAVVLALLPVLVDELRQSWAFDDVFVSGAPPTPLPHGVDAAEAVRRICAHGLGDALGAGGPKSRHIRPNVRTAFEPLFRGAGEVDRAIAECLARSRARL